jgi:outer membrane immunogenic protein
MIRSNLKLKALFASVVALALCATRPSAAQSSAPQQDHPITVGANYTYVRTNLLPGCECFNMNGGGAQFEYGLRPHLALLADFTGTHSSGITRDGYDLTQFTFAGGIRYRPSLGFGRLRPFGDLLLGAAHATGTLSPGNTGYGSSTAFAFQTGGGVELRLNRRWSLVPAQVDYLLTTFSNGADDHQNDLRLSAGVLFRIRH